MRALTLVLLLLAAGPSPARDGALHPAPAVWRTATLGRPGPAAPGWARTSSVIRDAHGDTEYRWGLIPAGLTQAGAFLDATAWRTVALAARSNAGAWAAAARGDGGNAVPTLPLRASPAPTAWLRGYVTATHCTLVGGETYRNIQVTVALYSDHPPRSCAPEQGWIERALRLLWGQADAYAHARRT